MSSRTANNEWILLPLRVIVGFGFASHGYAKFSRGPGNFGSTLQALGIPQPQLMAWLTAILELVGGISLMAGVFVVPFTVPLAVIMLTAMFGVHFQYGYSSIRLKGVNTGGPEFGPIGYELNLLYIAALVTLALSKPTSWSLDLWLKKRKESLAVERPLFSK